MERESLAGWEVSVGSRRPQPLDGGSRFRARLLLPRQDPPGAGLEAAPERLGQAAELGELGDLPIGREQAEIPFLNAIDSRLVTV